ncbi:MAG: hypothetical protein ACPKPY_03055 [Nitrososphaeraceae archaeon]
MLFGSKYWWKETGIILLHITWLSFLAGFAFVYVFVPVLQLSDDHIINIGFMIALIFAHVVIFLIITLSHRKAIEKNDHRYHLFQKKEWWKETGIILLISVIIGVIEIVVLSSFYDTVINNPDELDKTVFVRMYSIPVVFVIAWLLHLGAVERNHADSSEYEIK